jgi:hypothetical protein
VNGTSYTISHTSGLESVFGLWIILPIGIAIGIWLLLASSRFVQGDTVNNDRVAQLYGYSVCLIALVTLLFAIPSLVDQMLSFGNNGVAGYGVQSVRTFDAYKATRDSQTRISVDGSTEPKKTDAQLRAEYEAVRADRISTAQSQSIRSIVTGSIMVLLAIGLFLFHWRWLRDRSRHVTSDLA